MASRITFTVGSRDYRLDPVPDLRAAVLACPPGREAAYARAAAGRGRLFPPVAVHDRNTTDAEFLLPEDAVVFSADGTVHAGTPAGTADEFLAVLAALLDDLRAELPAGPLALTDLGLVLFPGRRLALLPGSVAPASEADSPAAAAAVAAALRGLAGSPLLGDGGPAWAWFADRLAPFAAGKGSLAELAGLAADALRRVGLMPQGGPIVPLPTCRKCGGLIDEAGDACPGCGKKFKTLGDYRLIDGDWLVHPRLGRKPYLLLDLPDGTKPPRATTISVRIAQSGDARVLVAAATSDAKPNGSRRPRQVLVVFSEPPAAAVLGWVRKVVAGLAPRPVVAAPAAPEPAPLPPPPPPPPPAVAITCGSCKAAIPAGRRFCPKCGALAAPAAPAASPPPPPADEVPGTLLESAGGAKRWAATADGRPVQVIDAPEPGACGELLAVLGAAPGRPRALPAVLDTDRRGRLVRVTVEAGGRPWAEWCNEQRGAADFHDRLAGLVEDLLAALVGLHAARCFYAAPLPDRVTVADGQARLDWPLAPRRPGAAGGGVRSLLGYTPPEFGHPDRPPGQDADVFALAAVVLSGLLGRDPPPSVSREDIALPHLRAWVPTLPAGWGGWLAKALAKHPADRFADPAAALAAWRALNEAGTPLSGFTAAAALHVGVLKTKLNPRNQDRAVLVPLPGEPPERTAFDGFTAEENYATAEAECPGAVFVAVADGISTVSSGELAAESVAESLAGGAAMLPADADPAAVLPTLFEAANAGLGAQIASAPNADQLTTTDGYPSATLAAALLTPDRAAVANLGDSRVYLLRAGLLDQLTIDGDEGTRHLREGADADAAFGRDNAKELVGWVGRFENAAGKPGRIDPARPARVTAGPGFSALALRPRAGDIFCCCSDGVSDYADAGCFDLADILSTHPPAEACRRLVEAANAAGGGDNISVVVARAAGPDADSSPRSPSP